jgi:hypothetical protein
LAIDEGAYAPDHPEVAASLNNLALILRDLGQPAAARPLQERTMAIDEAGQSAGRGQSAGKAAGESIHPSRRSALRGVEHDQPPRPAWSVEAEPWPQCSR